MADPFSAMPFEPTLLGGLLGPLVREAALRAVRAATAASEEGPVSLVRPQYPIRPDTFVEATSGFLDLPFGHRFRAVVEGAQIDFHHAVDEEVDLFVPWPGVAHRTLLGRIERDTWGNYDGRHVVRFGHSMGGFSVALEAAIVRGDDHLRRRIAGHFGWNGVPAKVLDAFAAREREHGTRYVVFGTPLNGMRLRPEARRLTPLSYMVTAEAIATLNGNLRMTLGEHLDAVLFSSRSSSLRSNARASLADILLLGAGQTLFDTLVDREFFYREIGGVEPTQFDHDEIMPAGAAMVFGPQWYHLPGLTHWQQAGDHKAGLALVQVIADLQQGRSHGGVAEKIIYSRPQSG